MDLLRNILTAIWCAVIIGTNVFGLMMLVRFLGSAAVLDVVGMKMLLMAALGLASLVSTKFLWAVLAVAALWMLLIVGHGLLVQQSWRPAILLNGLFVIVPTYLLARWNSTVRKTNFNPVKEF